jgi:hypothetical protein
VTVVAVNVLTSKGKEKKRARSAAASSAARPTGARHRDPGPGQKIEFFEGV